MNKFILIVISILLIFSGIYGYYYYFNVNEAEKLINTSIVDIYNKKYDDALENLKKVTANYKYNIVRAPSLFLLGVCYENKGDYKQALKYYRDLIALKDKNLIYGNWRYEAIINLAKLYRNKKILYTEEKLKVLKEFLAGESKNIDRIIKSRAEKNILYKLSRLYKDFLSLSFSINLKEKSLDEIKKELNFELGYLDIYLGNYTEAINIFSQSKDFEYQYGLALSYIKSGNIKKGLDILARIEPYDRTGKVKALITENIYRYAVTLYNRGKYKEAIKYLKEVAKLQNYPDFSENALHLLGDYYYKICLRDKALYYYRKVLSNKVKKWDEDTLFKLGLIYYDKKDYVRALKIFRSYIKKYPSGKRIKEAKQWEDICQRSIKYFN